MKFIKNFFNIFVFPIAIGLFFSYILVTFLFSFSTIKGDSMTPNLKSGEFVSILKQVKLRRGEVVIFDAKEDKNKPNHSKYYVKRIIGKEGDTVSFENGKLFVNNKEVDQSFISQSEQLNTGKENWNLSTLNKDKWPDDEKQYNKVPKGSFFVLGDDRSVSRDSRTFGYIKKENIQGVVKVPFWEPSKMYRDNINKEWKHFFY